MLARQRSLGLQFFRSIAIRGGREFNLPKGNVVICFTLVMYEKSSQYLLQSDSTPTV